MVGLIPTNERHLIRFISGTRSEHAPSDAEETGSIALGNGVLGPVDPANDVLRTERMQQPLIGDRVRLTVARLADGAQYEVSTCVQAKSAVGRAVDRQRIDRGSDDDRLGGNGSSSGAL